MKTERCPKHKNLFFLFPHYDVIGESQKISENFFCQLFFFKIYLLPGFSRYPPKFFFWWQKTPMGWLLGKRNFDFLFLRTFASGQSQKYPIFDFDHSRNFEKTKFRFPNSQPIGVFCHQKKFQGGTAKIDKALGIWKKKSWRKKFSEIFWDSPMTS